MPQTYKILGQVRPNANTLTNVYVTDASTSAIIGSLILTNSTTNDRVYQLILRPINETFNVKHILVMHTAVPAKETIIISGGIVMGPNTILAANTNATSIHFQAYGVEIT
jgi:hypothetical protein